MPGLSTQWPRSAPSRSSLLGGRAWERQACQAFAWIRPYGHKAEEGLWVGRGLCLAERCGLSHQVVVPFKVRRSLGGRGPRSPCTSPSAALDLGTVFPPCLPWGPGQRGPALWGLAWPRPLPPNSQAAVQGPCLSPGWLFACQQGPDPEGGLQAPWNLRLGLLYSPCHPLLLGHWPRGPWSVGATSPNELGPILFIFKPSGIPG